MYVSSVWTLDFSVALTRVPDYFYRLREQAHTTRSVEADGTDPHPPYDLIAYQSPPSSGLQRTLLPTDGGPIAGLILYTHPLIANHVFRSSLRIKPAAHQI